MVECCLLHNMPDAYQAHIPAHTAHAGVSACLASFIYHDMRELQRLQARRAVCCSPLAGPLIEGTIVPFPQHACMNHIIAELRSEQEGALLLTVALQIVKRSLG